MQRTHFTAFYPSRPFWAISALDFSVARIGSWFHDQMAQEVFSFVNESFSLRICRDGRILVRIAELEIDGDSSTGSDISDTVRRWGAYLDYLNAFYLLLDSASIEVDKFAYFNLHEITNRDAFRVTYESERSVGENIASESVASIYQMARYPSSYRSDIPIELDSRLAMRHVVSREAIENACAAFTRVASIADLRRALASFSKSLSEYKVGNYETSIVLAWFIIEAILSVLWRENLDKLNADLTGGRRRINRDRRDFLTGRDFSASIVSNILELGGIMSYELFQQVDTVRGYRNDIVHARKFVPAAEQAALALDTARRMVQHRWQFNFQPNTGYSVSGI